MSPEIVSTGLNPVSLAPVRHVGGRSPSRVLSGAHRPVNRTVRCQDCAPLGFLLASGAVVMGGGGPLSGAEARPGGHTSRTGTGVNQ